MERSGRRPNLLPKTIVRQLIFGEEDESMLSANEDDLNDRDYQPPQRTATEQQGEFWRITLNYCSKIVINFNSRE